VRALAADAHEYVSKPFTAEAIVDKLSYLGVLPQIPTLEGGQ
jgi:two-component system chemotaxis response regulator CheY